MIIILILIITTLLLLLLLFIIIMFIIITIIIIIIYDNFAFAIPCNSLRITLSTHPLWKPSHTLQISYWCFLYILSMLKSLVGFPTLTFHQPSSLMQTLSVLFSLFFFLSSHTSDHGIESFRSSIYTVNTNIYSFRTSPLQVNTQNKYDYNTCFITPFLLEFAFAI